MVTGRGGGSLAEGRDDTCPQGSEGVVESVVVDGYRELPPPVSIGVTELLFLESLPPRNIGPETYSETLSV